LMDLRAILDVAVKEKVFTPAPIESWFPGCPVCGLVTLMNELPKLSFMFVI
jgi:hypothetical protein